MDCLPKLAPFEIGIHGVDIELETKLFSNSQVNIAQIEAMAVRLSSDPGNRYNGHRAGRLMLAPVVASAGKLLDYLHNAKSRLHPELVEFMLRHHEKFQHVLDLAFECNFHGHNLLSASSILKTYLLKNRYGDTLPVESPTQMYLRLAAGMYGMHIVPQIKEDACLESVQEADDRAAEETIQAFWEMSTWQYTPATPSILNLGTKNPQGASCFLLTVKDSLKGMYKTLGHIAECNKGKGGVGVCVSFLRHGSIKGCGFSCGVVPYIQQVDKALIAVDQKGARSGAGNVYIDICHIDTIETIKLTSPLTPVANRTRVVNITVFMRRLFYQRLRNGQKWTLFCPAKTADLFNSFGIEFDKKYYHYENEAIRREEYYLRIEEEYKKISNQSMLKVNDPSVMKLKREIEDILQVAFENRIRYASVDAQEIMDLIISTQKTSGFPFIVNADEVNLCNMQANVGPVHSGNLCVEIMQPTILSNIAKEALIASREREQRGFHSSFPEESVYPSAVMATCTKSMKSTDKMEDFIGSAISMCNLSSINLQSFFKSPMELSDDDDDEISHKRVSQISKHFNFAGLADAAASVTRNLNRVIDVSTCPNPNVSEPMNLATRPLGIGVSGYADVIARLSLPYESGHARSFNVAVFACMYFNAIAQSVKLAAQHGPYFMFSRGSFTVPRNILEPLPHHIEPPIDAKFDLENPKIIYETFAGSPWNAGFMQFDMVKRRSGVWSAMGTLHETSYNREWDEPLDPLSWGQTPITFSTSAISKTKSTFVIGPSWNSLRNAVKIFGIRNSQFLTVMPTASTAQIMGNSESVEKPHTWLPYRCTSIGNFAIVPNALAEALDSTGLWTPSIQEYLKLFDGSLKYLGSWVRRFPESIDHHDRFSWKKLDHLTVVFKTMYETRMREHMIHSRLRSIYIDQSQSLNLFLPVTSNSKIQAMHQFANELCLKTGIYYLRQQMEQKGANFAQSVQSLQIINDIMNDGKKTDFSHVQPSVDQCNGAEENCEVVDQCKMIEEDECLMCGS